MKQVIWKQQIQITRQQEITLPVVSKFLSVQFQGENLTVWYQCNPDSQAVTKKLYVLGTGEDIPENITIRHLGTVLEAGGALVWHVYEGVE